MYVDQHTTLFYIGVKRLVREGMGDSVYVHGVRIALQVFFTSEYLYTSHAMSHIWLMGLRSEHVLQQC